MAMIDAALTDFLSNDAEVLSVLGGRVYYLEAPSDAVLPYAIVANLSDVELSDRPQKSDRSDRVRIDILSSDGISGRRVAETVRGRLIRYRGDIGPVRDCFVQCSGIVSIYGQLRKQHSFNADVQYVEGKT